MPIKSWTRIELGYELCSPPPDIDAKEAALEIQLLAARLPDAITDLRKLFNAATRLRWLQGGDTQVNSTSTAHDWVSELLTIEINNGLAASGAGKSLSIVENDLLKASNPAPGGTAKAEKPVGTRCILQGDRWINHRSYQVDAVALSINLPRYVVFFASLWWPCPGEQEDTNALLTNWLRSTRVS